MRKFEFKLSKVLQVNEIRLKQSQRDLSDLRRQQMELEIQLTDAHEAATLYSNSMQHAGTTNAGLLQLQFEHYIGLRNRIESCRTELDAKSEEVEKAREVVVEAHKAFKMMESLRDKAYATHVAESQKIENRNLIR